MTTTKDIDPLYPNSMFELEKKLNKSNDHWLKLFSDIYAYIKKQKILDMKKIFWFVDSSFDNEITKRAGMIPNQALGQLDDFYYGLMVGQLTKFYKMKLIIQAIENHAFKNPKSITQIAWKLAKDYCTSNPSIHKSIETLKD